MNPAHRPTYAASAFCTSKIVCPREKVFWIGSGVLEIQIFSSASRSNVPALSTEKCVIARYGTE